MKLKLRDHLLECDPAKPLIMGIVNIGDDSVADSTSLPALEDQLLFAQSRIADGAQIIDIGVQSGRTDTGQVPVEHELARLTPLVRALAQRNVIVSVDTWRAPVARGVIEAGAHLINDTSGLADPELARIAAGSGAGLVVMHTRAKPKQVNFPEYADPMADVLGFLRERIDLALSLGVDPSQLIVDPGPDFAKTPSQTIAVLRRLSELRAFDRPLLLAVSRKYFIGMLHGNDPEDRLGGTLAAIGHGLDAGAHILRVHDVAAVSEFLAVRSALRGAGPPQFAGSESEERLKWIAPKPAHSG